MATRTPRILVQADRLIGRLATVMAVIGGLAIAGLVIITVVAVLWRYGFNDPIFGISDLSVVTLTIVAGSAVAYGARHGAHVSVNVIAYVADRRLLRWSDALMRAATITITGLATWGLFTKACGIEKACITSNFSIEHRPFFWFLGLALGLYTLHVMVEFLTGLWHFRGNDPNEISD